MELTEDALASAPDVAEHSAVLSLHNAEAHNEFLVKLGIVRLPGVLEL
jgi:hypothetical protein